MSNAVTHLVLPQSIDDIRLGPVDLVVLALLTLPVRGGQSEQLPLSDPRSTVRRVSLSTADVPTEETTPPPKSAVPQILVHRALRGEVDRLAERVLSLLRRSIRGSDKGRLGAKLRRHLKVDILRLDVEVVVPLVLVLALRVVAGACLLEVVAHLDRALAGEGRALALRAALPSSLGLLALLTASVGGLAAALGSIVVRSGARRGSGLRRREEVSVVSCDSYLESSLSLDGRNPSHTSPVAVIDCNFMFNCSVRHDVLLLLMI